MGEYMTLLGAEDVKHASSRMEGAADGMRSAAGSFSDAVFQLNRTLEDHRAALQGILDAHAERIERAVQRAGEVEKEAQARHPTLQR